MKTVGAKLQKKSKVLVKNPLKICPKWKTQGTPLR